MDQPGRRLRRDAIGSFDQLQVKSSRLRLWSRAGGEWTGRLPELDGLARLADVVIDGEAVVVTPDGRADFDLLAQRIHGRRSAYDCGPVTLFVFDVLEAGGVDMREQHWTARRKVVDDLDLAHITDGSTRSTTWTADGIAMHEASRAVQAEGTVSKRADSSYHPGRSRRWVKSKHKTMETFQVAGVAAFHTGPAGRVDPCRGRGANRFGLSLPSRRSADRHHRADPALRTTTPHRHDHDPR